MHGGGTDSVIRIQNNVTIPAGALLYIGPYMRLEMGPAATINVNTALTSSGVGGALSVEQSTITAYRGCSAVSPATEHSTWSGITLMGNSSWPQGMWGFGPQSRMAFRWSHFSYADIAIQNGTGPGAAGGGFLTGLAPNTFYNNREDIRLWPYHNMVSGVEAPSMAVLDGCTFIKDTDVWFSSLDFINATDINPVMV